MATDRPRPANIVIVRHGESQWNIQGSRRSIDPDNIPDNLKGLPDHKTPLTIVGKSQARITGAHLARNFREFHRVYHSDYIRAIQTVELIVGQFLEPEGERMEAGMRENLAIAEQNFGYLELGVIDSAEYAILNARFRNMREKIGKFRTRPPNGDSWADVCFNLDVFKMLELYRPDRDGQNILIVTHSVTMQCFRYVLEHIPGEELVEMYEKEKPFNCGVSVYEYDEGSRIYKCLRWNQRFYPESLKTTEQ